MARSKKIMSWGGWGRANGEPPAATNWGLADARPQPPAVQLVGEIDHDDFRDAIDLVRTDSRLLVDQESTPELIVVANSRPDVVSHRQLKSLHQYAPLAGIVMLLGSWCEGETRNGRPWPAAHRCYWYEFPAWWRRQIALRNTGRCPDWARPANFLPRVAVPGHPRATPSLLVLHAAQRESADALADALEHAGYSTVWQPPHRARLHVRGAVAGIWDGAQLNELEEADLAQFCQYMARDGAPVIALLDFPRRDRVDHAMQLGAAAVLGKPWLKSALAMTIEQITSNTQLARAA
jgi:hypothetical protein